MTRASSPVSPRTGRAPGDHLVEHDADGVEVRARIDLVRAARLLGRHVLGRAHHDPGDGEVLLPRVEAPRLGDPEVDELEDRPAAGERHEDVLGLEIAVDDAERVRRLERLEDLHRVLARRAHRELSLAVDDARERLALEQLHDDVGVPVRRAVDVDDLDDVRAADLRGDARLLQEALDQARAARELRVQHLDRDPGPEHGVQRLVDRAHPSVPQDADEAVLAVDDATDVNHVSLEASLASRPGEPGAARRGAAGAAGTGRGGKAGRRARRGLMLGG